MTKKSWTLIDTVENVFVDSIQIVPEGLASGVGEISILKSTLKGGVQEGVEMLSVQTGELSYTVLPTRGMSLWKASVSQQSFDWNSPVCGPVHPKYVPVSEPSGIGFLDGFDEMFVRCGLESNGAPEFDEAGRVRYPLHGRIANTPARQLTVTVDCETGQVNVTSVIEEARFLFYRLQLTTTITTRPGDNRIYMRDEICNLGGTEAEAQMLYHVNFGQGVLDAGSRLVAPVDALVPRNDRAASEVEEWDVYSEPVAGFEEQVYFIKLLADDSQLTQVMLKNQSGNVGVGLRFSKKQLPYFTLWKNTAALEDGYVTGLEPGTNFPNPRSFEGEQGRVVKLAAGEVYPIEVSLELMTQTNQVESFEKEIASIRDKEPEIHSAPQSGWCSDA